MFVACHVPLFSNNQPTVHWVHWLASKSLAVAVQFICELALQLKLKQASPLTPMHIRGIKNTITDIPSRSFGSNPEYFCATNADLKHLFDTKFPLPEQNSWNVFQPSSKICMQAILVLRMHTSSAGEWRVLPKAGKHIGEIGPAMSGLWEWTLTFRKPRTSRASGPSQGSEHGSEQATLVKENKYKLGQYLARSRPLARRSPWPEG